MRVLKSDVSVHPSVCPLDCADTCSLSIEVKEGKVLRVRGSSANPFTRGKICSKVATGLPEQVHGSGRLTQPLILDGPKGSGRYRPISWDIALETIHERFAKIIQTNGPEAIAPLTYGGPMGLLAGGTMGTRFFNRLGASQVDASTLCAGVSGVAYESTFGSVGGISYEELAHSKLIVVWGNNITVCNLHLTKLIRKARQDGAKLVVVDPKRIRIADEADLHLPLLPGTDVVLAYAVAAELERQDALNDAFIAEHVEGAEAFLERAREYTLERAASICGLAVEDIEKFVTYWRDLTPAAISIGVAPERNRNGGAGVRAAFALPALTGNFGEEGAGICDVSGFFPIQSEALEHPEFIPPHTRKLSVLDIPKYILYPGAETPIRAVFIYNHNPIAVHPESRRMQQALHSKDLFVVGSEITMTDSMHCADIILPAATHLEYGDLYKAYGHSYLQRSEAVIAPIGEALPNTELFRRLAATFGFSDPCFKESDEELINLAISRDVPAMNGNRAMSIASDSALDMRCGNVASLLRGAMPDTPSGKIELYCERLEQECGQGLPGYKPNPAKGAFTLVSPSSENRTNSTFGGLEKHDKDYVVQMHPADADSLGLLDGQMVRLHNQQGEVSLPLSICDKIRRSTLFVPKGTWLKTCSGGQNINALIPGHRADIGGGACYNDAKVDVVGID